MSTPSDEQPTAETAAPQEPAAAAPPPPPPGPPGPSGPAGPPGPPPAGPPHAAYGMFGPVARPPRVPWINPERRTSLILAAVLAALVLIGAGFGIGYAVAPSGDHHGDYYRYGPMMRDGYGPGKLLPRMQRPNLPYPGNPVPTAATPSPTSS